MLGYGGRIRRMFLGGTTPLAALVTGANEKAKGRSVTYHLAFEDAENLCDARLAADTIVEQIAAMTDADRGNVAVKLSQIGMQIDTEKAREHLLCILSHAERAGIEVEIDAESRATLEGTSRLLAEMQRRGFGNIFRAALQMHVPEEERLRLSRTFGMKHWKLRIVKGAGVYADDRQEKTCSGKALLAAYEEAFRDQVVQGRMPYMATVSDVHLSRAMRVWARGMGVPLRDAYVLQKLYGPIGETMLREHESAGGRTSVYIPYVDHWCPNADRAFNRRRARYLWTTCLMRPLWRLVYPLRISA